MANLARRPIDYNYSHLATSCQAHRPLCANIHETLTPLEFTVQGGEVEGNESGR